MKNAMTKGGFNSEVQQRYRSQLRGRTKAELGAQRPGRVGNNYLKGLPLFINREGYNDAAYEAINVDSIPRDQVAALPVLLLSTHGNEFRLLRS